MMHSPLYGAMFSSTNFYCPITWPQAQKAPEQLSQSVQRCEKERQKASGLLQKVSAAKVIMEHHLKQAQQTHKCPTCKKPLSAQELPKFVQEQVSVDSYFAC